MQCDEIKQICLNYATNVPEWKLGLILDAVALLGDASSKCGKVQMAIAGDLAWMKLHPNSEYLGTIPIDRVQACIDAAYSLGKALYALEILLAQSDQFGFASRLAGDAEASYSTAHSVLKDLCRKHGCDEVAYKHG